VVTLAAPELMPHICYSLCYSSKSDATYVVNFEEYKGLATKIVKKTISKPIIVFVEMPEVEKAFSKVGTANLYLF
jgi:hypothetical protein